MRDLIELEFHHPPLEFEPSVLALQKNIELRRKRYINEIRKIMRDHEITPFQSDVSLQITWQRYRRKEDIQSFQDLILLALRVEKLTDQGHEQVKKEDRKNIVCVGKHGLYYSRQNVTKLYLIVVESKADEVGGVRVVCERKRRERFF